MRGIYLPENGDLWRATLLYSPHRSSYLKRNVKDGDFTNTGGGYSAHLQWEKNLDWGSVETVFAHKNTGNKLKHKGDHFYNYTYSRAEENSHDFCSSSTCKSSQLGGYGTFSTEKSAWTAKQDWKWFDIEKFGLTHRFKFGWEVELARAEYLRDADTYTYIYANDVRKSYTYYPARHIKVSDHNYTAYLEDSIQWQKLNVNLGLRFDRNAFLGNNDFAPRFSTSYDLFGDQRTQLFAGISRYYSGSVLSYKLRNRIGERIACNASGKCNYNGSNSYDVADLHTPYSNERVLGLSHQFADVRATLKWVQRQSRNQFTRAYTTEVDALGLKTFYMTNDGRSTNHNISINIETPKAQEFEHFHLHWKLGGYLNKNKANYTTYSSSDLGKDISKVIVDGKLKDITEAPTLDYNAPWSAFLNVDVSIPAFRLKWGNRLSYNAGYQGYKTTNVVCPNGNDVCGNYEGTVKQYNSFSQGSHFLLDWRIAYHQPTFQNQYLALTLDVNNVLNRTVVATAKSSSNGTVNTYKLGRNFWLGASYNW